MSSGYHNGNLIDITDSMINIHQGDSNYHQSIVKGPEDSSYNLRFLRGAIKLHNSQLQVLKLNNSYILKKRNTK